MFRANRVLVKFQSLQNRAVSFDVVIVMFRQLKKSQSLWSRAGLSTYMSAALSIKTQSQSLWNRAGSFDQFGSARPSNNARLNPFRAGQGLSTKIINTIRYQCGFNPFRTGQGLSTWYRTHTRGHLKVSIPLEQGRVFRRLFVHYFLLLYLSQSLQSRAVSFDVFSIVISWVQSLNPFRAGRCLSTCCWFSYFREPCVSIPLEQGGVFRHFTWYQLPTEMLSQSLQSRAVSFDCGGGLVP